MTFIEDIGGLLGFISQTITDFVHFFLGLPDLFFNFLTFIPSPLNIVIESFISFLIVILMLKVVRLIVG